MQVPERGAEMFRTGGGGGSGLGTGIGGGGSVIGDGSEGSGGGTGGVPGGGIGCGPWACILLSLVRAGSVVKANAPGGADMWRCSARRL